MDYEKRMDKLEELRKKYPFLAAIIDIGNHINRVEITFETDEPHKENFELLEAKLKAFQNTLYGLNATNLQEQHINNFSEAVKRGDKNGFLIAGISKEPTLKADPYKSALSNAFGATYSIYTNHTGIGKHIVKEGLPKEEAQAICSTCNAGIKVPPHKNIKEMIGYMWILEEQS